MGAPFFCLEEMERIMKEINELHDDEQPVDLLTQSVPWLFGAGIAAGHLLTASSCTLPQQGRCAVCGGCVVALGSLVGWAMLKKRQGDDFYSQ
ncbi:MAG: hypothetical protein methR_P3925 [Methyloprofundus sp.]|nr:MAG: hypothetical protein methR_P3925 [Methyloprofundus sp.]